MFNDTTVTNKTHKMVYIAMLTALYVVLSAMMKIPFIGNISLDLGYIVFAVACLQFGFPGIVVGVLGCTLESILFSAYGFSISWAVGNLIVGLVFCCFRKSSSIIVKMLGAVAGCVLGIIFAKTGIECYLYSIPFEVKIVKNAVACAIDSITMIFGIVFSKALDK